MATSQQLMWEIMEEKLPKNTWIHISVIYSIVEKEANLIKEDYEPSSEGRDTDYRWMRNIRNILQGRKTTGRIRADRTRRGFYQFF